MLHLMIYTICTLGDKQLEKVAEPVTQFDEALQELLLDMQETMHADSGVGIAAPQVGVSKQIFIAAPPGENPLVCINPSILETSQETSLFEEGCLSVPGVFAEIERPTEVTFHYQDVKGRSHTIRATGYLARIMQHEYDHLQGKLFVDKIQNPKVYQRVMKKYKKRRGSCV